MRTLLERWMLGAAWTLIAGSLAAGGWIISSRPDVQPWVLREAARFERMRRDRSQPLPPSSSAEIRFSRNQTVADPVHPLSPWTGFLTPQIVVGDPYPPPPLTLKVLRRPIYSVNAGLDGVDLSWSLEDAPPFPLEKHESRKDVDPTAFLIERSREGGEPEVLSVVGPKVRSLRDGSAEPRVKHRYWVSSIGVETDRRTGRDASVTVGSPVPAEASTPSAFRVKLVGGDRNFAILQVETYNRREGKWQSSIHRVSPGGEIGKSGWTLEALRFEGFTLTADVKDDGDEPRVLKTKD